MTANKPIAFRPYDDDQKNIELIKEYIEKNIAVVKSYGLANEITTTDVIRFALLSAKLGIQDIEKHKNR